MDPGIGAARPLRQTALAGEAKYGFGKRPLYGGTLGLDLPARKGSSMVSQDDLQVTCQGEPCPKPKFAPNFAAYLPAATSETGDLY